ncbi:MAG: ATP-binding cassette domain-containing protein [Clostridia bacterium]|nr:ATP-binding cassette domain-containing protein [Clostridia bacterium]
MELKTITVKDLYMKYFGGYLGVDMVSFDVNNESLAVYGKAMSGKTSLLRCIANLEKYEGQIYTNAKDLVFSFDLDSLKKNKTVKENISTPLKLRKIPNINEIVLNKAKIFHIDDILDKKIKDITLSQKRLTILTRAFVRDADLYLLDNPLKDVEDREKYFEILKEEIKDKFVVYATDSLEEAKAFNKVLLMAYKKGIAFGNINDMLKEPKTIDVLKLLTDYEYENVTLEKDNDKYCIKYLNKIYNVPEPINNIYVGKEVVFSRDKDIILDMYFDKSTEYLISKR